jgi:hypothetical protein
MARNRRHQSAAIRFVPALRAVVLCVLIGGSAVGYVWQKDQIRQLGVRYTEGEKALEAFRRQNETLRLELDELLSSATLERLVQQYQLGLVQPSPDQVIQLPEPPLVHTGYPGEQPAVHYAAHRDAALGRSY